MSTMAFLRLQMAAADGQPYVRLPPAQGSVACHALTRRFDLDTMFSLHKPTKCRLVRRGLERPGNRVQCLQGTYDK